MPLAAVSISFMRLASVCRVRFLAPLVISLIACFIMIRIADTAHGTEVGEPVLGH